MMMGTADEIVKAPEKGPVFMEDLPEEEQAISLVKFNIIMLCEFRKWFILFSSLNLVIAVLLFYETWLLYAVLI